MAEILVVEDNSTVRMVYRMLLGNAGHCVTEAVDGHDAGAKLQSGRFDLVITDLWMPGLDGFAVIAKAKQLASPPRVLAITGGVLGSGANDPSTRAALAGADAVIEKPMLGDGLLSAVDALLGADAVLSRAPFAAAGADLTPAY
jgi:CheY-like chemotaxis protein